MEEKTQAITFNDDGSISTDVGGKTVKFVHSSDLVKVKDGLEATNKGLEDKVAKLSTDLAETVRVRDENSQSRLTAEAATEQMEKKYKDYEDIKGKVTTLETEGASHKEDYGKLETEISDILRRSLVTHGAPEDSIKDKTLDQLRHLDEAAKLFGNGKKAEPAKYDGQGGAGAGATLAGKTGKDQISAGFGTLHPS